MNADVIPLENTAHGKSGQPTMNVILEKHDSGWVGLSIALGCSEIDALIARLNELKSGKLGHFHLRCDNFDADAGVADIEITTKGVGDLDNLKIE